MPLVAPEVAKDGFSGEGGYVKGVVTYMVMDDLVVTPMSTISGIALLSKCNVTNVGALEEKVVSFGMDDVWNFPFSLFHLSSFPPIIAKRMLIRCRIYRHFGGLELKRTSQILKWVMSYCLMEI